MCRMNTAYDYLIFFIRVKYLATFCYKYGLIIIENTLRTLLKEQHLDSAPPWPQKKNSPTF